MFTDKLSIRTKIAETAAIGDVQRIVHDVLRPGAAAEVTTLDRQMDASIVIERTIAMLSEFFALLGAALAALGLYSLLAYTVARRTREIGVRMALGANPGSVLSMVMRQGFVIVAIGLTAGGVLAAGAATALRGILYGITPFDPLAWGLALTAMIAAAGFANFVPARRAMRVDPMTALRTE